VHVLAGSPYSPDAASDWWNFGINALIGLATLAALALAMVQTRLARIEAKEASKTANEAAYRESLRDRRETERERQLRVDDLRKRAARQALSIWTKTSWAKDQFGKSVFAAHVLNDSDDTIRDIVVRWDYAAGSRFEWTLEHLRGKASLPIQYEQSDRYPVKIGEDQPYEVEFTDKYADRWLLLPDRSIKLLQERTFRLQEDDA
jgi:hypothetical protein